MPHTNHLSHNDVPPASPGAVSPEVAAGRWRHRAAYRLDALPGTAERSD